MLLGDGSPRGAAPRAAAVSQTALNLGEPILFPGVTRHGNRTNSQRSTGPQTEAGKERSCRNSFRHGLTSSKIVLPGEDPAEYDAFRANILEQYQPANATEQILAEELSA